MKNPEVTFEIRELQHYVEQWARRGMPTPAAHTGRNRIYPYVVLFCPMGDQLFCSVVITNRPPNYKIARSLRDRLARRAVMYLRAKYG